MVVAVVAVVIAYLAFSSVGNALVYYRPPASCSRAGSGGRGDGSPRGAGGGGSVSGPATDLRFAVTDGESRIEVRSTVAPTRSFREGAGAVVEGPSAPTASSRPPRSS